MMHDSSSLLVRRLGVGAAVLGALAMLAGSPYAVSHAQIDVAALSNAVRNEDDHVTALELAAWIKEQRSGLRVVDIRSAAEFEAYHLPMAERISIDSLSHAEFSPDETIVLYSEGGTHAAQGWVFLRALGYTHVYFLRGGVYEWLEQVMNPTLRVGASAVDSTAFAKAAEISRYFGGIPRSGVAGIREDALIVPGAIADSGSNARLPAGSTTSALAAKIRRRGC